MNKRWLYHTSLATKLRLMAAGTVLCVAGLSIYLLWHNYANSLEDRKMAVRQAVQLAYSVMVWSESQAQVGKMTRQAAQQQAAAIIRDQRYGDQEYFWIQNTVPVMVMHPIKPQLQGQNLTNMQDPDGKHLFVDFNNTVRQHGEGFVDYLWPKPGESRPQPKLSFVKGFEPWGWIVGSGVYVDDLRNQFWQRVLKLIPALVGLSALLLVLINSLAYSITHRIKRAVHLAEAIASGNVKTPVTFRVHDEIGALMLSLKHMSESLNQTVGRVRQSADSMAHASREVAIGSQDLSGRTETTAANLQQTASSVTELARSVHENSEAAQTAKGLADQASASAARGNEVVDQVVNTMGDISQSARKITDIISVIDGIAFQTNILALNAAVEAARAGEQGRGFAVVAAEVRTLAQHSAQAAKEIKNLILNSVERVETGSSLVQETGAVMRDILTAVNQVTALVGRISASAAEQSEGIGMVNSSVSHLENMTQQNAALVEQSAAAAASMQEQARLLNELMASFQLLDNASAKLMAD